MPTTKLPTTDERELGVLLDRASAASRSTSCPGLDASGHVLVHIGPLTSM